LPIKLLTPQNEGQFSLKFIAKGPFRFRQAAKVCSLIEDLKQLPKLLLICPQITIQIGSPASQIRSKIANTRLPEIHLITDHPIRVGRGLKEKVPIVDHQLREFREQQPLFLKEKSSLNRHLSFSRIKDQRAMIRTQSCISMKRRKRKLVLPLRRDQSPIQDTLCRIPLPIGPSKASTLSLNLTQG
jgi:hypothetical protein